MSVSRRLKTLLASGCAFALAMPAVALAQASDDENVIVVTAQKREQNLQDVAISITALSGDRLESLGMTDTSDLAAQTPGLRVLSYSPALTVYNIRGVSQNDFADHFEGPVAIFMDEAYIGAQGAVDAQMIDMERVEVLRGPQGTLFGRNATGGLIHYISRKPSDRFEGYAAATIGSYNQVRFQGAVNLPVSDAVQARIAGGFNFHDGWVKNAIGRDLNESDTFTVRAQLKVEPADDVTALFIFRTVHNDETTAGFDQQAVFPDGDGRSTRLPDNVNFYGTCPGCDPLGYQDDSSPWRTAQDKIGSFKRELYGITAKIDADLGSVSLASITDMMKMDKFYTSDSDGSSNDLINDFYTDQDYRQFSQELRLSGQGRGFDWVAGLYFLDIVSKDESSINLNLTAASTPPTYFRSTPQWRLDTRSWAVFGQSDINLTDQLSLTLGARYTEDRKKYQYVVRDNFGNESRYDQSVDSLANRKFSDISLRASLNWKPTEDLLTYLSYNRGHKGGNYVAPLFGPINPAVIPHDSEVLTALEAGIKLEAAGGHVRLNVAGFLYDYDDYQAFSFINLNQAITNLDAKIYGAEAELQLFPLKGLYLSGGLSLLNGTAKDVVLPNGRITDTKMPLSPSLSANFLAAYTVPLGRGSLSFEADGQYVGGYYFQVLNSPHAYEKSRFAMNGRIRYQSPDEKWQLTAFIDNIFNAKYRQYTTDVAAFGYELNVFAPPRWAGATVRFAW